MGQELTARTHHRGVIRKRVMPLQVSDIDALETGGDVKVFSNPSSTKSIGKLLTGAVQGHALAMLRLSNLRALPEASEEQAAGHVQLEVDGEHSANLSETAKSSTLLEASWRVPYWWPTEWMKAGTN